MWFTSKISIALLAALAAAGEARDHHGRFYRRGYGSNETNGTAVSMAPLGTAAGAPAGKATLTYTLGTGSSTTVVTTTIFQTSTRTDYHTVTAAPALSGAGVAPVAADNVDTAENEGPTTTISSTSYTTTTVTVVRETGAAGAAATTDPTIGPGSSGCAPKATVTVTEKEVVTVTVSPAGDDGLAATGSPTTVTVAPLPVTTSGPYSNGTDSQNTSMTQSPSSGFLIVPSGYRH